MNSLSDTVMVRCPTRPVDAYPATPAQIEPVEHIRLMWADPVLQESVRVASSVLYDGVAGIVDSPEDVRPKKVESVRRALVRYAIRISTRTTPFGTFGGFAMVGVGDGDPVRIGREHTKYARAGSGFVRTLARAADPLRDESTVQANPAAVLRSGRLVALVRPHGNDGAVNEGSSVRATRPVRAVLRHADTPVRVDVLLGLLTGEFPDAGRERLYGLLRDLMGAGLLVSELDSSIFDPDPLQRLRDDPVVAPHVAAVGMALDRYTRSALGAGSGELGDLYRLLRPDPHAPQEEVQVDLRLDLRGRVPGAVVGWAEKALDTLIRTTPVPPWQPEMQAHAERFAEHFGEALVPLCEVVDPERGIGFPAGYPTSRHGRTRTGAGVPDAVQRATQRLRARLVELARRHSRTRVELTEELLRGLPVGWGRRAASYDVFLQLQNPEPGDPVRAVLGPVGVGMPAGRVHGRFAVHDPRCHRQMVATSTHERSASGDVQFFEVDYVSNRSAVNNVSLVPSLQSLRMTLTTGEFDDTVEPLRIQDILIGVGPDGFHLLHRISGRRLTLRTGNLVAPDVSTDLVRFLEEIAADGFVRPMWHWGDLLDTLDFLPGVTVGDVELVAPQWRVPRQTGTAEDQDRSLREWIRESGVPDHVHVGVLDNRLLLDLRDRLHRDLLRRERSSGAHWVSQAAAPSRIGWVRDASGRGYAGEVVVSVEAARGVERGTVPAHPRWSSVHHHDRVLPPGRQWWYARLYGAPEHQNDVLAHLAGRLPEGSWFHVRYRDTADHLRVRVRCAALHTQDAMAVFHELVDDVGISHYVLDTYRREIERYGGLDGMHAAERLFCAESSFLARHPDLLFAPGSRDTDKAEVSLARSRDSAQLIASHLHVLCDDAGDEVEVLRLACSGYRAEFEDDGPAVRRAAATASRTDVSDRGHRVAQELARRLSEPGRTIADELRKLPDDRYRTQIRQALVHMFANRMGLSRLEEYQAVFVLDTLQRAERHRAVARA
ncbi:lantibiotic dehydratase [Pseudonocardia alni]|uniref:lantibiotic dehydratase n=1 Tax=Pseudonocardia alni TaxID=33907 RepID=UPI00367C3784